MLASQRSYKDQMRSMQTFIESGCNPMSADSIDANYYSHYKDYDDDEG